MQNGHVRAAERLQGVCTGSMHSGAHGSRLQGLQTLPACSGSHQVNGRLSLPRPESAAEPPSSLSARVEQCSQRPVRRLASLCCALLCAAFLSLWIMSARGPRLLSVGNRLLLRLSPGNVEVYYAWGQLRHELLLLLQVRVNVDEIPPRSVGQGPRMVWSVPEIESLRTVGGFRALIPIWLLVLGCLGTIVGLWLAGPHVAKEECRSCGYCLVGNVSGRCPECGQPVDVRTGFGAAK